jgi:hypothetical protein
MDYTTVVAGLMIGQAIFFFNKKDFEMRKSTLHFVKCRGSNNSSSNNDDVV